MANGSEATIAIVRSTHGMLSTVMKELGAGRSFSDGGFGAGGAYELVTGVDGLAGTTGCVMRTPLTDKVLRSYGRRATAQALYACTRCAATIRCSQVRALMTRPEP